MSLKQVLFVALQVLGVNKMFRAAHRGRLKVLLYHNVLEQTELFANALTPAEFEAQLIAIKRDYNPVSLKQDGALEGWCEDRLNVLITFDDGFVNNYEFVFPLLVKHGLKACFFFIVNCVEQGDVPALAHKYMKDSGANPAYATLTLPQIREMAAAGMMIGSHSLNHDNFSQRSFEDGIEDARTAQHKLAALTGLEIGCFAFPWGFSRPAQAQMLTQDYRRIFTTKHGFNAQGDTILFRNEVVSVLHLQAAASGALDFFSTILGPRSKPDKQRILCLVETLGRGGGAEQLLVNLLPELQKRGYEVEVVELFYYADSMRDELEAQGIKTHQLNFTHRWMVLQNLWALHRLARARQCSVFWGHLYFGNFYASALALTSPAWKSVTTLHSEGYMQNPPRGFKARSYAQIDRAVLSLSSLKVAVSHAVARDYAAYFRLSNVSTVYNGVSTSLAKPIGAEQRHGIRADWGAEDQDFLVLVPSRYVAKKGHAILFEALTQLKREKNWTPRVVAPGHGPLLEPLRAQCERLGLVDQVRFTPPMPQSQLFALIQAADVICMPSLREPFGIAAAEAMILGAPALLTQVDGFLELIGDSQAALLAPPNDATALASLLFSLYEQPTLRHDLGVRGRERIKNHFDISVCAAKWARIFDRLSKDAQ